MVVLGGGRFLLSEVPLYNMAPRFRFRCIPAPLNGSAEDAMRSAFLGGLVFLMSEVPL